MAYNHRDYMRTWRKSSAKVMRHREFRRGVEAMRLLAQQMFRAQIGQGTIDGYTAANLLSMLNPSQPVSDGNLVGPGSEDPGLMERDGFESEESSRDDDNLRGG